LIVLIYVKYQKMTIKKERM